MGRNDGNRIGRNDGTLWAAMTAPYGPQWRQSYGLQWRQPCRHSAGDVIAGLTRNRPYGCLEICHSEHFALLFW